MLKATSAQGSAADIARALHVEDLQPVSDPSRHGMLRQDGALTAMERQLARRAPLGALAIDAAGMISDVNDYWSTMTGWAPDLLLGRAALDLISPKAATAFGDACAALREGADTASLELGILTAQGQTLITRCMLSRLEGSAAEDGQVLAMFLDISDRAELEQKQRAREMRLRQVLDNTVALVGILDPDGTLIEANRPALAGAGLERGDVIGRKFWDCHWWCHDPLEQDRLRDAVAAAARGEVQRYDATVRMADDSRVTIDFMLSPVEDEDGRICLLIPSALDISDRIRSEQRLAYAMREVNHRSKNMLSVVQSMLRQMQPADLRDFVDSFGQRLRALAACQDLLVRAETEDPTLQALIRTQLAPFEGIVDARVTLDGPELFVTPEVAQSLGMAIYELITNASKYGALSGQEGQIAISWQVAKPEPPPADDPDESGRDESGPQLQLLWQESGGPTVCLPARRGFGSVVLEDMLAMALGARTRIDYAPEGLRWAARMPLAALSPA
ncbi:MAG: PAS domain S-box protein [Roseinatronobacter sp.]